MNGEFAPDDGSAAAGGATQLMPVNYVAVLFRYLWLLMLSGALGGGLAYYYGEQQPLVYEATAMVLYEDQRPQILNDVAPVVEATPGNNYWAKREFIETQLRLLGSTELAELVVERLGLDTDLRFLGLSDIDDPVELDSALANVEPALALRSAVSIQPVDDSTLFKIRARAYDPEVAADIATTLAEVYREQNLERQLVSSDAAMEWLDEKYETLRQELEASEDSLVSFLDENDLIAVTLEEHVSLSQLMLVTSDQLVLAQRERDRNHSVASRATQILETGDWQAADVPAIYENALIQQVKSELFTLEAEQADLQARGYLENHPELRSVSERILLAEGRLEREVRAIVSAHIADAAEADATVRRLQLQLDDVEQRVRSLGRHEIQYARLQRETEVARDLFAMIERRREEVALTRNSLHSAVDVLERARPSSTPVSPNKLLILLVGLALGVGFGVVIAVFIELSDNSLKNHIQLERDYRLTLLGFFPAVRPSVSPQPSAAGPARGQKWNNDTYVHDYPKSQIAESCRTVRTNLSFLGAGNSLQALLITSPGPREGKTMIALNLGQAIAQSGKRVLLIDADLRRPRLHKSFGLGNERGLSTMLTEDISAEDVIQRTQVENLDVLASGAVPPNPAELLGSQRFMEVLADLRERYDQLIFDSPPVAPVTDAVLMSSRIDGVVLIVRALKTQRAILGRTVEQLRAVNANLVGTVFNDFDVRRRGAGRHYYQYYHRYYGEYYGEDA